MGQSPSSKNYTENPEDMVLIQGNADLSNGKIKPRLFTTEITKKSIKNDIILTVRAPVGDLAINEHDACIGRGVCAIRSGNNKFVYYLLENIKRKHIWERLSQGSTFESINSDDIKNLKINIPSLLEQYKIANFLTKIDEKIDLLEKTLVLYQRYKTYFLDTLINKNNSPLEKMSNIIRITSSKNKNNENLLVLSINNKLGFISQNDQFENHKVASEDTSNYKIVEKDDFAYNPARINVGSIARLRNYNKGIVSPMYIVFKIDKDKVNLNYFENYIDSYDFRLNVLKRLEGSVRLVLSAEALKNIMIPLPNLNEQEKIGNFLEYNNKRIQLTNKKLEELKEYKKGLLQKMFC